jgi:2-oxoglutarate dehydrogenase complex, dehydrogenase (E1) component, and related enzymes
MSSSKNKIFETTSFLSVTNSSYIDELYDKFVKDPNSIQESWREFFLGLAENKELIKKIPKALPGHQSR